MAKFSKATKEFIKSGSRLMSAVVQQSTQALIEEAQKPVSRGGNMRIDTGFLRSSGRLSYNGLPSGPSRTGESQVISEDKTNNDVILQLAEYKLGSTIWFGWTANYARHRERVDGFQKSAAMKWKKIVNDVVKSI